MDARITSLVAVASRQHGLFTRPQAAAAGLDRHAVRNGTLQGRWRPLSRTVFCMAAVAMTPLVRAMAAVLDAGPGAVLSHTSAAWLLQLPGFAPTPLHVTRPATTGTTRSTLAVLHRSFALPDHHVRVVAEIPVTTMARTLFDLGGAVHPGRLERAVDTAVARGLVTLEALHAVLGELGAPGRAGGRALRRVLGERLPGEAPPESELERRFLALLRAHGLPQPERQVVLGDDGGPVGRVDFFFREARLVVELDGRAFHSAPLDRVEDGRRDLAVLAAHGRTLRLTWRLVVDQPHVVVAALRKALRCAA